MKKYYLIAAIACIALLTSCEQEDLPHTGDISGTLYGIWALNTKTETIQTSEGVQTGKYDYSDVHFYLSLSELPVPCAIAKKGSFTDFDLDDVDVDAVTFTFNADQKKLTFNKMLWLSDELLTYNMILKGTFDVLELTDKNLVLQQEDKLLGKTTTYSYSRMK